MCLDGGDEVCDTHISIETPPTESNISDWSEKYYPGLPPEQHQVNNNWFRNMLAMLTDTGILVVPSLLKSFNKQGEEISNGND